MTLEATTDCHNRPGSTRSALSGERLHALRGVGALQQAAEVPRLPAPELERRVLHRSRAWVDAPVRVDAQALDTRGAEVDARPRGAVHALAVGLEVVDRHAQPLHLLPGLAQGA